MRMEYNEIYDDKVHKYTVNIPKLLFKGMSDTSRDAGFEELAPWVRAVMQKEVKCPRTSLQDILGEKEATRLEYIKKNRPVKRSFMTIKIKRILDIINPKQEFFDFRK